MANRNEQDQRIDVINSLLKTPHRKLENVLPLHKDLLASDPEFYGHLASWYFVSGDVRDHQDAFTIMLIHSAYPGHRDAGLAFLRQLEPYRADAVDSGYRKFVNKTTPTAMRTELSYYWWDRENHRDRLDGSLLYSKKAMRNLLKRNRVAHSEYTDLVLFKNEPPEGSVHANIKRIASEKDPVKQAKMLLENRVPFRQAMSVLKNIGPAALVAIIEGMSPQDVINNLSMLKKRGALDNPDLKSLVDKKLNAAKTNKRVSALKVKDAIKAAKLSDEDVQNLEQVADCQVKSKGRIKRSTALLVDKSGSLELAIEIGKQLGSMISAVMDEGVPLEVIAFDTMARKVAVEGKSLADWEKGFAYITANGGTSCGSGIAYLNRNNIRVEQIIMITDECEQTPPSFVHAYNEYFKNTGERPHVVIVRVGSCQKHVEMACRDAGIAVDTYEIGAGADKYSFTNLIPLLCQPSKMDLLMEIMDRPLPARLPPVTKPECVRAAQLKLRAESM